MRGVVVEHQAIASSTNVCTRLHAADAQQHQGPLGRHLGVCELLLVVVCARVQQVFGTAGAHASRHGVDVGDRGTGAQAVRPIASWVDDNSAQVTAARTGATADCDDSITYALTSPQLFPEGPINAQVMQPLQWSQGNRLCPYASGSPTSTPCLDACALAVLEPTHPTPKNLLHACKQHHLATTTTTTRTHPGGVAVVPM